MGKFFEGKDIKEVWNYRLSTGVPVIDRSTGTWVVHIYSKDNPQDYDPVKPETMAKPLESHDTGIAAEVGDERDTEKVVACYEWLYSVRDKYALGNIEEMKPHIAKIEAANKALAELGEVS